jgi:hypothetical protein
MEEQKVLKIKVGEVYINGKNESVFQTAWKKKSKDGKVAYYEARYPIFVQTIKPKESEQGSDI